MTREGWGHRYTSPMQRGIFTMCCVAIVLLINVYCMKQVALSRILCYWILDLSTSAMFCRNSSSFSCKVFLDFSCLPHV